MENKFIFSESTSGFDLHITNSIPGYNTLIELTSMLSSHRINEDNKPVIDIGGSTGKLLNLVQQTCDINIHNKLFNVDPTTFNDKVNNNLITFIEDEAQYYLNSVKDVQVFFSIFTLQFLSGQKRKQVLQLMYDKLDSNGVVFIAEKFFIESSEFQELFSVVLRNLKLKHFEPLEILEKDFLLLKHLKLKTETEFLYELSSVGFKVKKYWQSLHFNGYICEKNEKNN
jgi:hypothetical protein